MPYGACVVTIPGAPNVSLDSVSVAEGTSNWGYPLFQFPVPVFPWEMRLAGITGEVVVRVKVATDGTVVSSSVVRSTQREFEAPALAAVERWRFYEFRGLSAKERVGMVLDCTIRFALDET